MLLAVSISAEGITMFYAAVSRAALLLLILTESVKSAAALSTVVSALKRLPPENLPK
jgi:hypothetical protein